MPLYVCRWQNGDFSIVSAASKVEAICILDEVGNAEDCDIFTFNRFSVHFKLKDDDSDLEDEILPLELQNFGESTFDFLMEKLYPVLDAAHSKEGGAALSELRHALEQEKTRRWGAKVGPKSKDTIAASLQRKDRDLPTAVAERIAEGVKQRMVLEMKPASDKKQ